MASNKILLNILINGSPIFTFLWEGGNFACFRISSLMLHIINCNPDACFGLKRKMGICEWEKSHINMLHWVSGGLEAPGDFILCSIMLLKREYDKETTTTFSKLTLHMLIASGFSHSGHSDHTTNLDRKNLDFACKYVSVKEARKRVWVIWSSFLGVGPAFCARRSVIQVIFTVFSATYCSRPRG